MQNEPCSCFSTGITGPNHDARGFEANGLATCLRTFDHDQPHFLLELSNLYIPEGPGQIVPLAQSPAGQIKGWIADCDTNTLNALLELARIEAERTYHYYVARGSHVMLMDGEILLAMTDFNSELPDTVQLGRDCTLSTLRGKGHAHHAVGLYLAQAAERGVKRATLFSASDMAAHAHQVVGFEPIGDWTLFRFDGLQTSVAS